MKEIRQIQSWSFAEACYESKSIPELKEALEGEVDATDLKEWNLTEPEWREQIEIALENREHDKG